MPNSTVSQSTVSGSLTERIQINFERLMISMQVPSNDWQSKDWNERLYKAVEANKCIYVVWTQTTIRLEVELDALDYKHPYYELPRLLFLQQLGQEFGLDYAVLNSMMWLVYDAWTPHRPQIAPKSARGEASDDENTATKRADSPIDYKISACEI